MMILKYKCFYRTILFLSSFTVGFCVNKSEVEPTSQSTNEELQTSDAATTADMDFGEDYFEEIVGDNYPSESSINCEEELCVRKCCKTGFAFDMLTGCVDIASHYVNLTAWRPEFGTQIDISKLVVLFGNPPRPKVNRSCYLHEENEFYLQHNGHVFHKERKESFSQEFYCIDKMVKENGESFIFSAICYKQQKPNVEQTTDYTKIAALATSCAFLTAILVLHFLSQPKKDLQTKCMISACFNLLLSFILLIVNMSPSVRKFGEHWCVALGISVQFFTLSFYFWLNVMCFEISRIIRRTVSLLPLGPLQVSNRRYMHYSLYAWGIPLIISVVTCAIQYLPEGLPSAIESYPFGLDFGNGRCWLIEKTKGVFAYFYDIEIFLHVLNSVLMGHAALLLHRDKLACLCCQKNPPATLQSHINQNHVALFWQQLSIFIMYVFIWGLNCAAIINSGDKFWRVVDILITLQGVYLFIIVTRTKNGSILVQACGNLWYFLKSGFNRNKVPRKRVLSTLSTSAREEESTT